MGNDSSNEVPFMTDSKTKWTNFTYNIPPIELQKFKACKVGTKYKSARFKSEHGMKWYLLIHPNGWNKKREGYCMVELYLESLPKEFGAVFVYYVLRCDQTHAADQNFARYDKAYAWGRYQVVQSLSELSQLQSMSFSIKFRILRIDDKTGNTVYEYPLKISNLMKQERFQWEIDQELLQKMKTASFGKRFCPLDVLSDKRFCSTAFYSSSLHIN